MRSLFRDGFAAQAWAVVLATATVMLVNLGGPPLWDEDEPKNAGASAAMLASGDWIVPTFNGRLRPEKPPLVNWVQLAGYACCGVNETGARIGSALLTVGSALLTAAAAARLFPHLPLVGLWAGLAFGTCVWAAVAGRAATPDAVLGFWTTLALWLAAGGLVPRDGVAGALARRRAAAVGAACGAAMLAKGPVGLVLPLAAFGCAAWWQECGAARGGDLVRAAIAACRRVRPGLIVAGALAVAGPWYALVTWRTDGAWLRGFLGVHNLERALRPLEGHGGPWWYYLVVLAAGFFPWSIVAAVTAAHAIRGLWRDADAPALKLVSAWAVVWVGSFSVAGTKLPGYVWPVYPALAIATAAFLEEWRLASPPALARWMRLAWSILGLAGIGIGVGLAGAAVAVSRGEVWLGLIGLVPAGAAVLAWREQTHGRPGAALGWLAATSCATVTLLAALAAGTFGRDTGVRPLVAHVAAAGGTAAAGPWASFRCTVPSLVFYSGAAARAGAVEMLFKPEAVRAFVAAHPDARIVVPVAAVDDLLRALPPGHGVLARSRILSSYRELCLVAAEDCPVESLTAGRAP